MDLTRNFKVQAENLRKALASSGFTVTSAQALELVARQYGQRSWAPMQAALKRQGKPVLNDLSSPYTPEAIEVDMGDFDDGPAWYKINHEMYDTEILEVLHRPALLVKHLKEYHNGDENTVVIGIYKDSLEHQFTVADLKDIEYTGNGAWRLQSGLTMRFDRGLPYVHEEHLPFVVPRVLDSVQGVTAVALRATVRGCLVEGTLIVAPTLDAKEVKAEVLGRLEALEGRPVAEDEEPLQTVQDVAHQFGCEFQ
jgi:hypothetical protein